jgi:hypothetical protein
MRSWFAGATAREFAAGGSAAGAWAQNVEAPGMRG